ncbi:hypothetical protein AB0O01_22255 [Streptomyces sp. NPDC093252]|uniref:hypothetical protein n=1 Tax=Streptomyces sp. NPDC093252 TaxID=3154980 RepID=UPI0034351E8E
MTRSLIRGRPKRARAQISARLAQSALGVVIAVLWLGLALPVARGHRAAQQEGTSAADLALPLIVAVGAVVAGTYGYLRRTRRPHTRTIPSAPAPATGPSPLPRLDEETRALLVAADDSVRTSREELDWAGAGRDPGTTAPFRHALQHAETELSAAFAIRHRYDEGVPGDDPARRQALTGIAGRCTEAGRLLDAEAPALDAVRDLEGDPLPAVERAESQFRALTARVAPAERALLDLARRHTPAAVAPVTGFPEQARDRLVFAALRLNHARRQSDLDDPAGAAAHLRAAEGAVTQASVLLAAVTRLGTDLAAAEALLQQDPDTELPATPYDPLDLLRRRTASPLPAHSTTATTEAYLSTHRAAITATPRTLLAAALRLLPTDPSRADTLALESRARAEQDVRTHGNPHPDDTSPHEAGTTGATLGGILLGPTPASYGGPETRQRRTL